MPPEDEKRATQGSGLDRSSVFYGVLTYLLEHPAAQDTVEGVRDWWVEKVRVTQQTKQVQAALAELVALGLVRERVGRDGRVHYRVDRRKLREMRRLLNQRNA
jgi:hypothetical protein